LTIILSGSSDSLPLKIFCFYLSTGGKKSKKKQHKKQ